MRYYCLECEGLRFFKLCECSECTKKNLKIEICEQCGNVKDESPAIIKLTELAYQLFDIKMNN